jgi:hypothetical protein
MRINAADLSVLRSSLVDRLMGRPAWVDRGEDGVTLSRKGAKSRTGGRKLRSTGTKARTRVGRIHNSRAELESSSPRHWSSRPRPLRCSGSSPTRPANWTSSTPATAAMLQQTRTIFIIFVLVADPVGSGVRHPRHQPGGQSRASDPGRRRYQDARLRDADFHAGLARLILKRMQRLMQRNHTAIRRGSAERNADACHLQPTHSKGLE